MTAPVRDVVCVAGKTGHGKTLWARLYTRRARRLVVYDPLRAFPVHYLTAPDLVGRLLDAPQPREFRLGVFHPDDAEAAGWAAYARGECSVVVEECSTIFRRGAPLPDWARDIVYLGRHQAVSLIVLAQRAASIPIEIRSQATRFITFAQHEGDDVDALRETFGKELALQAPALPVLECLDWKAGPEGSARYSIRADVERYLRGS